MLVFVKEISFLFFGVHFLFSIPYMFDVMGFLQTEKYEQNKNAYMTSFAMMDMGDNRNFNLTVTLGQNFTISTEYKPTAGYILNTTFDSNMVKKIKTETINVNPKILGSGAIEQSTFTALQIGKTEITVQLKRPFSDNDQDTVNFFYNVVINPS